MDAAAQMADAGDLCDTRMGLGMWERHHAESGVLEKWRKLKFMIDAGDLKSIGHVLVRAKSDAIAMKIEAANLRSTTEVLVQSFARHKVPIGNWQDGLTRIIMLACRAANMGD